MTRIVVLALLLLGIAPVARAASGDAAPTTSPVVVVETANVVPGLRLR